MVLGLFAAAGGCGPGGHDKADAGLPESGGPGGLVDLGGGVAVAYQIDVAHTGNQPASSLRPPLTKKWSVDLQGPVSYPLIVGGRAFVTVAAPAATTNPEYLYALDVTTGQTIWGPLQVGENWSNAAFDDGKVYVVNDVGEVMAYDAASGARVWSVGVPSPQYAASTPPIAKDGMVFTAGTGIGGTLLGLDGVTGAMRWSAQVMGGDDSSPALGPEGLFVSYACLQTYGFEPTAGTALWYAAGPCEGGGGMTAALYQGRLWTRDWSTGNAVFDASTGVKGQAFASDRIPAFLDTRAFVLLGSTLSALDLTTFQTLWSFTGDGTLASAPLVVNGEILRGIRLGPGLRRGSRDGDIRVVGRRRRPGGITWKHQRLGLRATLRPGRWARHAPGSGGHRAGSVPIESRSAACQPAW